jgi:hypothetical protein
VARQWRVRRGSLVAPIIASYPIHGGNAMNVRPLLPLALLFALAGCASSSKVMVGAARPPIDPALVQIYSTPPLGAVDIAQLESSSAAGFGTQGQTDAAVARLKREAAALGANGVILMGVGSSGSPVGMSVGAGSYGRHSAGGIGIGIPTTQKKAAGVAIYVPAGAEAETDAKPATPTPTR